MRTESRPSSPPQTCLRVSILSSRVQIHLGRKTSDRHLKKVKGMEWRRVLTARQERHLRPVPPCSYRGRWGGEDGALRPGVRNKPVRMKERGEESR